MEPPPKLVCQILPSLRLAPLIGQILPPVMLGPLIVQVPSRAPMEALAAAAVEATTKTASLTVTT